MTKLSKKIPKTSGVYFFRNAGNKIIYVGKAANLKNRLSSYFLKNLEARISGMVAEAKTVSFKKTESEVDALILEAALIKKLKPKYNILMRDDKNYFFVGFTAGEFPKIFLTHQPNRQPQTAHCKLPARIARPPSLRSGVSGQASEAWRARQTKYIGPFTDGGSLKNVLYSLRKIFPYCSCSEFHNRLCLRAHLKKCAGVCCLKKEKQAEFFSENEVKELKRQYRLNIARIKKILLGERKSILISLRKKMKQEAAAGDYEEAAKIRDKIFALENVFAHSRAVSDFLKKQYGGRQEMEKDLRKFFGLAFPERVEIYDISNISGKFAVGAFVVFADGKPSPKDYRRFKIRGEQEPNDQKMMKETIERRLKHQEWPFPDLIIVDGGAGQLSAACFAQKNIFGKIAIPIIAIAKGKEELYFRPLAGGKFAGGRRHQKTALFSLNNETRLFVERARDEAHRFAIKYHRKIRARF